MTLTIYHNPRCSKSRQALQLLQERGLNPQIIEYLSETPSLEELKKIGAALGGPQKFLRTGEQAYKDRVAEQGEPSDEQLYTWMVDNPIIIERPLVINGEKVALGRPPENVLDIL